jgi:hypothetical protein
MWATELTALAPRQELGPQDHPLADPLIYTAKCFFLALPILEPCCWTLVISTAVCKIGSTRLLASPIAAKGPFGKPFDPE